MQKENLLNLLQKEDFHLDPLARLVLDNPEILKALNGGNIIAAAIEPMIPDGSCFNESCH